MNKLLIILLSFSFGCALKPAAKEPVEFLSGGETYERVKIDNKKYERYVLYKASLLDGDYLTFKFQKLDEPKIYDPDTTRSDKAIIVYYRGAYLTWLLFEETDTKEAVEANIAFLEKEVKGHKVYLPLPSNYIQIEHLVIIRD